LPTPTAWASRARRRRRASWARATVQRHAVRLRRGVRRHRDEPAALRAAAYQPCKPRHMRRRPVPLHGHRRAAVLAICKGHGWNDPMNCGTCGHVCAPSQTCVAGACACAPGLRLCATGCASTSPPTTRNCGNCNGGVHAGAVLRGERVPNGVHVPDRVSNRRGSPTARTCRSPIRTAEPRR